ncbi:LOW QUALITY PROTEIN: zinc finger protein 569-like [Atheta coriaria]|uniref:LOW QUALITY PROTEIN: zinc finger protein 569-like n=1 Tax=Dalotia coriaria TaxID=877792 RepID=UPI0031F462E4
MPNQTYQEDYYRPQCLQQSQSINPLNPINNINPPVAGPAQCVQPQQYSSVTPYPTLSNNSYYNSQSVYNQHHDYYPKTIPLPQSSLPYDKDWLPDARIVSDIEKGLRLQKIETIEITSKDLSPASCCSNFDLLLHDYYNKNYTEFPSCSQVQNELQHQQQQQNIKQVKYCSIQKPNYECNYILSNPQTDCFQDVFPSTLPDLNFDPVDGGSDDSDIIVEDLDDDDYIEDQDPSNDTRKFNCLLCNVSYSPIGSQFYYLTAENPLTMSSQKSVSEKLKGIVGNFNESYLCCQCLGLINTIDHLEMKLQGLKDDLIKKYESSNGVKVKIDKKTKMKCNHKLKCKICKCSIGLKSVFTNHMRKHRLSKRFLCDICGKRFTNAKNFKIHIKNHSGDVKTKLISGYSCSTCKKVFRTMSNLKEHVNYCSGNLPFKCTKCHKKFPSTTKLKNHIKLKHEKKFTSICSICNIGFVQISDYKRHMISHSTHKKFNCSQCDKSYKTLSNLNFHMKFHAKKLPFLCEICTKGFMRKEYLESHMASHTGEKNFCCTMCDKKFVSQKNLDAHLKYHNGGINKKSCNICGKVISKIALEDHLRTHSNLKEFKCDGCEERFNTKSSLQKHRKRKHDL